MVWSTYYEIFSWELLRYGYYFNYQTWEFCAVILAQKSLFTVIL